MTLPRLGPNGLDGEGDDALGRALAFGDSALRGVGQVMFQNNSWTGLVFLAGVAWNSPLFAAAVLLGALASTAAATALGADQAHVRTGLFGFNGALVGVALLYFLKPDALTWVCVVLAAGASTIVMAALMAVLERWSAPPLTAPFVLVSLCVFLATARFGRLAATGMLPAAGLPRASGVEGVVTASTLAQGLFEGVGQVFFQANIVTGVLFLFGLLLASRRAGAAALAGSLAGMLVAWAMGAAEPAIRAGAYGFNSALAAIALAAVASAPGWRSFAWGLLAAAAAPFAVAACAAALQPLGVPALTLPFVLVTWTFLFAGRAFARLRAPPRHDAAATSPGR